jgi:hypothetical protein
LDIPTRSEALACIENEFLCYKWKTILGIKIFYNSCDCNLFTYHEWFYSTSGQEVKTWNCKNTNIHDPSARNQMFYATPEEKNKSRVADDR